MLLSGCSDANVKTVKNGTLGKFKGVTVGKAFDNCKQFESTSWRSFKADEGKNVVEFKGSLPLSENLKITGIVSNSLIFQFAVNNDKTFELLCIEVQAINNEGKTATANMTNKAIVIIPDIYANANN
jgi:hypothetical protein